MGTFASKLAGRYHGSDSSERVEKEIGLWLGPRSWWMGGGAVLRAAGRGRTREQTPVLPAPCLRPLISRAQALATPVIFENFLNIWSWTCSLYSIMWYCQIKMFHPM